MEGDGVGSAGDGDVGDSIVFQVFDYVVFRFALGRHEIVGADCRVDETDQVGSSLLPASAIENDGDVAGMCGFSPGLAGLHVVAIDHDERGFGQDRLVGFRWRHVDADRVGGDDVALATLVDSDGGDDRQAGEVGIQIDQVDGVLARVRLDGGGDHVAADSGYKGGLAAEMREGDGSVSGRSADKHFLAARSDFLVRAGEFIHFVNYIYR